MTPELGLKTPPRPRLAFRVGAVGHCPDQLPTDFKDAFAQTLATILGNIHRAVQAAGKCSRGFYANEDATVRVISCLAEGADRIITTCALKADYEIQAVLPFPAQTYARDFSSPESKTSFQGLLSHPRCTSVFQMDGNYDTLRDESYEAAGRVLLQQSDLIIAIWNGQEPRGKGGTGQLILEALTNQTPVIWIRSASPERWYFVQTSGSLQVALDGDAVLCDMKAVTKYVLSVITPPRSLRPDLRRYYSTKKPEFSFEFVWQSFLRLLTDTRECSETDPQFEPDCVPDPEQFVHRQWNDEGKRSCALPQEVSHQFRSRFLAQFAWADRLAAHCVANYRASFLANYVLASLAVAFALIALPLGWIESAHPMHDRAVVFTILEGISLTFIIVITVSANSRRWHSRALDYRLIAEWLRQYRFTLPLAGSRLSSRPARPQDDGHFAKELWVQWHLRAIIRETGLLRLNLTEDFLKAYHGWVKFALLKNQADYHTGIVAMMGKANHNLHVASLAFFFGSLAVCVMHLISHSLWLIFASAVLPAMGAACTAIRYQAEFEKVVKRSKIMSAALSEAFVQFDQITCRSERLVSVDMSMQLSKVIATMNEEVADWITVFRDKPVEIP